MRLCGYAARALRLCGYASKQRLLYVMQMRHAGGTVVGVFVLVSTALGLVVPNLISKSTVNKAAFVLYTFFGMRLLYIAWRSVGDLVRALLQRARAKVA